MIRVCFALLFLLSADIAHAKPCNEAQVKAFAALFTDANGNVAILIARVRHRLETEDVTCWAKRGDKAMILELGKRFETGDGVTANAKRAETLYMMAATSTGGPIWLYTPGFQGAPGRVMSIDRWPVIQGLREGTYRRALMHIRGRAARSSVKKGMKWMQKLAKDGYQPAQEYLASIPIA
jgi:TPR repeat protein